MRKNIAAFLILILLSNSVSPTISLALTSGPTAPEYSSFEPVDTTDMVNLTSGDLAYNIPLLEVPGASGGYPISLSYHSGILPNEEASWVGLGWTLNPGAITRTVNGYADDDFGAVKQREDINMGGETSTYSASVGLPFVGFGLSVSNDSNQGVGVGGGAFVGAEVGNARVGLNASVSAYTRQTSVGISASVGALRAGMDFDGDKLSSSVSAFGAVEANISSTGITTNYSLNGFSMNQSNSNAGKMTVESEGVTIPVYVGAAFVNLGYNYTRYYSFTSSNVSTIGSLYAKETSGKNPDDWGFDSYPIFDPNVAANGVFKNSQPEKLTGASFHSVDNFQVNAQGLNGVIYPFNTDNGTLFRQNEKDQNGNYLIKYNKVNSSFNFYRPVSFRFKNDFSNSFSGADDKMNVRQSGTNFSASGYNPPTEGWNPSKQQLAGSKHVEWFSNAEIQAGTAKANGFIDYQANTSRATTYDVIISATGSRDISKQIGGFMITNESGVTYHYALPVYAYGEYSRSFLKDQIDEVYQTNVSHRPYAYEWLLTAVTGTDFVDRNQNGLADDGDWGYWVTFEHGKWSNNYLWRNPAVGFHSDLNEKVNFYSRGIKEIYFLDAIKTSTHVALFEKDYRNDGKGLITTGIDRDPRFKPLYPSETFFQTFLPTEQLRLKNIYLLSKADFNALGGNNLKTSSAQTNACAQTNIPGGKIYKCNVFDDEDSYTDIRTKSLRVINFEHTYDLQANTPNSFKMNAPEVLTGKLTLTSLRFLGRGGFDGIPAMKFEYGKNPAYNKDAFDIWQMYKSDYTKLSNENLSRYVTASSSGNTDAWSLIKIKTSLGADINISYESDEYVKPVLYKSNLLNIADIKPQQESGDVLISFHNPPPDLHAYFSIGTKISLMGVVAYYFEGLGSIVICDGDFINNVGGQYSSIKHDEVAVTAVNATTIRVNSPSLYNEMKLVFGQYPVPTTLPYPKINVNSPCYKGDGSSQEINYNVNYKYDPRWMGGNLSISAASGTTKGGGIRVKEISVDNGENKRITQYGYGNGYTSYEPMGLDLDILMDQSYLKDVKGNPWEANDKRYELACNEFLKNLQSDFSKLLSISREVPSPGVLYESVTMEQKIQRPDQSTPVTLPGKTVFEFNVFDEDMIEIVSSQTSANPSPTICKDINGNQVPCVGWIPPDGEPVDCLDQFGNPIGCGAEESLATTPFTLNNLSASVGLLKSISVYGESGVLIQKTTNNYLNVGISNTAFKNELNDKFNNQGVISQRFNENKVVTGVGERKIFSKKTDFPVIPLGQKVENYKNGVTTESTNLSFDFYSGAPVKVLNVDAMGNKFISEIMPAYKVASYSGMTSEQINSQMTGMGLKVNNLKNKHMLSQTAYSKTYKVNSEMTPIGLTNASVQTWSDLTKILDAPLQNGIWRKKASYSFTGDDNIALRSDGLHTMDNFSNFSAWNSTDIASPLWQKNGDVLLYDTYSHALEEKDLNGIYAATKMSLDQSRVFATVSNAGYNEFAFSGAEEVPVNGSFGGNVLFKGEGFTSTTHTGVRAVIANPALAISKIGFQYSFEAKARTYHVSLWSNKADANIKYKINNVEQTAVVMSRTNKSGAWYLLEADISLSSANSIDVWCEANSSVTYFDDFRIHPQTSAMTSYVYNTWGELTHILDANNLYTEYQYDGIGKLKSVFNESFKEGRTKTSETIYHYANKN